MRIKEEFKKSGYFWLPSSPERIIPGTLTITDGGNIEIELFGVFDNNDKLARIIGHIEKHGLVTLDDCFYKNQTISVPGISKSSIFVNNALIGVAYDDQELVLLNTFQFSIEGIDEWVGLSGIKVENQEKGIALITYSPPEEVLLNLNNGMKLLVTFSYTPPGCPITTEAKITQKTYFKLTSEQEIPLNDFRSAAYKITTLLGFAIDKTVCIEKVSATSNAKRKDIGHGKTIPVSILLYYATVHYTKQKLNQRFIGRECCLDLSKFEKMLSA